MATTTDAPQALRAPTGRARVHFRTPTLLQMEASECGAASLGIVLAHHGMWVPLEDLREECGVSRDGSKASNVLKAARHYGMDAKGMRIKPEDLTEIDLPAIAFWNFNHFLVIEGYGPGGVHLNDPASGPRTVGWREFDDSFTGVIVMLSPSASFTPGGSSPSLARGLRRRFHGGTSGLVLCLMAGAGLLVPGLLTPAATRIFVNEVLTQGNNSWRSVLIVAVILAALTQVAFTWLQQITLLRLSVKLSMSMSTRFMEHLLALPLRFYAQRSGAQLVTRVRLNDEIASLLSSQLAANLLAMLTSTFFLVLMVIYDWQLTLVAVCFSALNVVVLQASARRQRDGNLRVIKDSGALTATAVAGLSNIESLKAGSEEGSFFARWAGYQAKTMAEIQDLGQPSALMTSVPLLLISLNTAVLLGYGGLQVMNGTLSIGTLLAFQLLAASFAGPIAQLVGFGSVLRRAAGNLATVDDTLNYPRDPDAHARPRTPHVTVTEPDGEQRELALPAKLSGVITVEGLTFGYSPLEPPLLQDFHMRVEPGQRIALVGATGSGKSTVAMLITGLLRPWSGRILFDGIPRELIPRETLAASLAHVSQDILLFEAPIRENLTLWDPTISESAVVRATHDAMIHADILKRPQGLERPLQEGGRDWSGGQRQRLEIARALTGDPSILIMDEATSALDPVVEQAIDERVRARGCTCLIVAHRLSTIRDADEILVLEHGTVAERGTHDQLIALGGIYAGLAE